MDGYTPGESTADLATAIHRHLQLTMGHDAPGAPPGALFSALSLSLRDLMLVRAALTRRKHLESGSKQVHYLSMEFLVGRLLANAVMNLELEPSLGVVLQQLGATLEELADQEQDAGLGNGGLGRLAACFLDSCASQSLPVTGYGIRYRYGMFRQEIHNGYQLELPDPWLEHGNPWEIRRPALARRVPFCGRTERNVDACGRLRVRLVEAEIVIAVPYDVPIPGHANDTVNTLRLWSAESPTGFDLWAFNDGQHQASVTARNQAEEISLVLYPGDASDAGKLLRLRQQYFLVSATVQDVLARWQSQHGGEFARFSALNCFQLNDSHPLCAIPELMRLLMDEHGLEWEPAWELTRNAMAYTNHTVLPEALEHWPEGMFERLLPRLMEIIREIDRRFCAEVAARWPQDAWRIARMAIITPGDDPQLRMAQLGIVGSFSVNGVASLHSQLLRTDVFPDFHALWPGKFNNKTNGVTHRRWLLHANPGLSGLISEAIGDGWIADPGQLERLRPHALDPAFGERWWQLRQHNKTRLALLVERECGVRFAPGHLFAVQVKRIHEYKRQLLNVLHVIHLYDRIRNGGADEVVPRCVLIGGKAAPGYATAKLILKLVNNVAAVVNADPLVNQRLTVAFLPNYGVSAMGTICTGTDVSEQISTAGKEASGTGNMKFMMNGALTIGTMDGANVEIHEAVGEAHFFRFGLAADEVAALRTDYDPIAIVAGDPELQRVLRLLCEDHFSTGETGIFQPLVDAMLSPADPWVTAADFASYLRAQRRVAEAYRDRAAWACSSIINTAGSGRFSSDRTIREYASNIWGLPCRA